MKFKYRILYLFVLPIAICSAISSSNAQAKKTNIVFILADDFGYTSLNSYGADKNLVRTPHIDRLADEGMRFTN